MKNIAMSDAEQVASSWNEGALIFDYDQAENGQPVIRAAAFVFPTEQSFAWVEPSYLDPYGASSPALRRRSGQLTQHPNGGLELTMDNGGRIVALPVGDDHDLAYGALRWFTDHLNQNGIQFAEERERVRELITDTSE